MKYYLIAGEASGDLHASNLMRALNTLDKEAKFRFFGGDLMQAQGGALVKHYREMAYMGFVPVLLHLPAILRSLDMCKKDIAQFLPDVVILVDYPGFNLKIAKFVHERLHIPVHYYISPKIWAWKEYRIHAFKKYVDKMFCILPFEVDFYKKHDYNVHYVGNPTVDAIKKRTHQDETFHDFIENNRLESKPIIALLAGSRQQEIKDNLPTMLEVVSTFPEYQAVIAGAPGIEPGFYREFIQQNMSANIVFEQTYRLLAQSQAALVTSGTATLETALLNLPQAVCYKTPFPRIAYWAFQHLLHTPYISLVNLICGKEVVKELFATFFSINMIRNELARLLYAQNYREEMQQNYQKLREVLGSSGASEKTAKIIYASIVEHKTKNS